MFSYQIIRLKVHFNISILLNLNKGKTCTAQEIYGKAIPIS